MQHRDAEGAQRLHGESDIPIARESASATPDVEAEPQLTGEPCPACGSPHDPADRFCHACGTAFDSAPPTTAPQPEQKHIVCKNCGAQITTDPTQLSYTCPFCDSTYVVEVPKAESGKQEPEFVIGFRFTQEQAEERFHRWLRDGSWFRPGDLATSKKITEKLRGIYLPFWSFSMLAESKWGASIGEHWYRTETYTTMVNGKMQTRTRQVQETEWWPLEGKHHRYYSHFLVSASQGLPQAQAERVKPFRLEELKRFAPYFLAGWSAEEYQVEEDAAQKICQQEFYRREKQNVAAFLPGDTNRSLFVQTEFSGVSSDLILLPVFLLSYNYEGKVYRFLLNGQTGKAVGDKPVSHKRIAGVVIGVLAFIAVVVLIFMLLSR